MKKLLFICAALILSSCEISEDVNVDTKNPTSVPAGALFANATKELHDQMITPNVNLNAFRFFAQYWTETTYTDEANYDLRNRDIPGNNWLVMYRNVLTDLTEAEKVILEVNDATISEAQRANQLAAIEVLRVFTWHVLVDTYGYIPYFEALDIDNITPAYDEDAVIYDDLVTRLDAAIQSITPGQGTFTEGYDLMYDGDAAGWLKFANSLKLRIGLRYAEVDNAKAQQLVEEAVAAGVFTSAADQASLDYLGGAPNTNPIWEDLVQSGRKDFVAANTIVDIMNPLNDPRRAVFFQENLGDGVYTGGPYAAAGNTYDNSSQVGTTLQDPMLEGVLIEYAEVAFSLAEAAARGYNVGGTAEEFYNAGITASIEYWYGLAGLDSTGVATLYLANPAVAYATAAGDWRQKIGTQKWLALYNNGFEGWSTFRRLGYPEMNISGVSELPTPRRYIYPNEEPTLNPEGYTAAAAALGGDELSSRVFWDVN